MVYWEGFQMSNPLRIALVAEGPTDSVVIESALRSMLQGWPFVLNQIFPATSVGFGAMGTGWVGVYRWCRQSAKRGGGSLSADKLIFGAGNFDFVGSSSGRRRGGIRVC